jgi:ribosome-associated protein
MRDVLVHSVPVELFKILKFEGLTASGAEAKAVIAEGQVTLNGVVETQKRKKLVVGDVIEFAGHSLQVVTAVP